VVADLNKEEDIITLVNKTITEFGQLDILVNNAGFLEYSFITDSDIWHKVEDSLKIDVKAPILLIHLLLPYLQKSKGTIINTSSAVTLRPVNIILKIFKSLVY
jgi:short-subunit dehydrogenase involved in D-alanine esterification of teichoic acids